MVLGALVIVIVGILIVNYFKDKKSDTLTGINTGSESQKENELKSDTIEVGQKLTLPEVSAKKPTLTKPTLSANTQTLSGDTYTVVKGDTLWSISLRAYGDGYKWVSVAKANKLVNPNVIHVGNVLTLPR